MTATWTLGQIAHATNGRLVGGNSQTPIRGVGLNSRTIEPGEMFVAIRGVRFDAHAFIPEAVQRGASAVLMSDASAAASSPVASIIVPDTTQAFADLARFHRQRFAIPVVAITGSCGKTTTKELLAGLLAERWRVLKTPLTENNHIGLPQTLLRLDGSYDAAVVELGSNHPGEIAHLAQTALPTVAAVTNIGPAHLEYFGSLMGVLKEKLSLIKALGPGGIAVVSGDQLEVVLEAKRRLHPEAMMITFGSNDRCDIQARDLRRLPEGWSMRVRGVPGEFIVPLPGAHNAENALAALACARALGLSLDGLREPLQRVKSMPMRSEIIRGRGNTIILNDCYNANPLSFSRALETLKEFDSSRRVVIAGEMLELGRYADSAHQAIARLAAQSGVDCLVAVGAYAQQMVRGASEFPATRALAFDSVDDIIVRLPELVREGDAVLVKGSRKFKLEHVVAALLARYGAEPVEPAAARPVEVHAACVD